MWSVVGLLGVLGLCFQFSHNSYVKVGMLQSYSCVVLGGLCLLCCLLLVCAFYGVSWVCGQFCDYHFQCNHMENLG